MPWVLDCVNRHKRRYDFRDMMIKIGGLTKKEYYQAIDGDAELIEKAAEEISKEAAKRIKARDLRLRPVEIREKEDHSTFKARMIGRESAMQQIIDYIAVKAADDILNRRIVPQQASSIMGRGPTYGVKMISRWIKADRRAEKWAADNGKRYSRKCRYFVKLDIQKCYQSLRIEPFMAWFSRDCGNEDLLWLWRTILESHRIPMPNGELYEGFMIGALPSQEACQYVLSFLYRYAMGLHKMQHGRPKKLVTHMILYMDDQLLLAGSRRDLKVAAEKLTEYAKSEFGLTIKSNWQICDIDTAPIDMMGYRIYEDGSIVQRPRVFLRTRRLALRIMRKRGAISLRQARRACSYKGFFKQKALSVRSRIPYRRLKLSFLFRKSAEVVSRYERRKAHESRIKCQAGKDSLYAPA